MSDVSKVLDKLDSFKDEIAKEFEKLGLGKDQVLRVNDAIDVARSAVASHGPEAEHHDLNDELAKKPGDHPREQGQKSTPINTDDNVNEASEVEAKPKGKSSSK